MARKAAAKKKAVVQRRPGTAPGRGNDGGGRQPPFVATEAQRQAVCALVSVGTSNDTIGEVLQIPVRTLVRHFGEELRHGRELIHARIGAGITAKALSGDNTMMIFYAKAQMRWQERHAVGFEDDKGAPVSARELFTINIQGLER